MNALNPAMLLAIQQMIDARVEEKVAKLQAEHDEIVKKLKQNITGMIKPGAFMG